MSDENKNVIWVPLTTEHLAALNGGTVIKIEIPGEGAELATVVMIGSPNNPALQEVDAFLDDPSAGVYRERPTRLDDSGDESS